MDPSMVKTLVIMNSGIVVATIFAMVYFIKRAKAKENGTFDAQKEYKIRNRYNFYSNNVFLRKRIRRIAERYSSMACYDQSEVIIKTVQLFEKTMMFCIGLPVIVWFLLKDIFIGLTCCLISYIYYDIAIDKELDAIYKEVLLEVGQAIQSIRTCYMEYGSIPKAVLYCEKGKYLEAPMKTIHSILIDVDGDKRLEEFSRTSPIRILKTLAKQCYITNDSGDTTDPVYGSAFQQELTILRTECDAEYNRLEETRIAFKSLAGLSLLGIALLPIMQWYLLTNIPGTSILLNGTYGAVVRVVCVAITCITYYVISVINRPSVVNQVDVSEWIDNICQKYKRQVKTIMPKDFKSIHKWEKTISGALSSQTLEYIYTKKVLFFFAMIIASAILLFGYTATIREAIYNNYGSLSFIPMSEMTEKQYKAMVEVDKEIMAMDELPEKESVLGPMYQNRVKGITELDALSHADRITIKFTMYNALRIKWFWPLIVFGCGLIGWWIPNLTIMFRKKLVTYESTEDVLQLQNLMIVLANTNMTVRRALYWLTKQATVHKAVLRLAYVSYAADPFDALNTLYRSVESLDFRRMILNLKTSVYDLTLKDAFSNLILDKDQALTARERALKEELESKKQWAKLLAVAPAAIGLVFYFIVPILYLGLTQLLDSFSAMSM